MHTLAIGHWEIIGILAAVLLVFGARRLPELARSMGSSITQFKKGLKEEKELPDGSDDEEQDPT